MKKIISLLLLMTLLAGCSNVNAEQSSKAELRTVGVETVEAKWLWEDVLTVSGNIVPTQTVKASFKIPGVLYNVAVSEGESVVVGQTLATLDKVDYNIQLKRCTSGKIYSTSTDKCSNRTKDKLLQHKREAATAQKRGCSD